MHMVDGMIADSGYLGTTTLGDFPCFRILA